MKKSRLKKYAELIARKGANVQKGQEVYITAELDCPDFVVMLTEECYKAGASKVTVDWSHQPLQKVHMKKRSLKVMSHIEKWEEEKLKFRSEKLPCMIYLTSEDPDGLKGINQEKVSRAAVERYKITKPYIDKMENKYQWCIAGVPGAAWAKKVFPNERRSAAIEKLWEAILDTSRVDEDPCKAWERHNADIRSRCDMLNSLKIKTLEYKSSNGTDLRVGLIDGGRFCGGSETTIGRGVEFNPNIPSEEVFTSPMKGKAEGIVYSSKPFSFRGQLIENFSIEFRDGKVSDVHAEKNEDLLRKLVSMDEGAAYLGECALIPYDSPINNSGILFYNTLFDENAACHLALGRGFNDCLFGYEDLTNEQCREKGINDSMIHEDFMIGTKDLDIFAYTEDGRKVQIFKNGNWA